jgi:hypothetical protein
MTHTEHEDAPWTINIGDHAQRTDSPMYTRARRLMIAIVKQCQPWFFGDPPYQDHHGGGLWVKATDRWRLYKNIAGEEWSAQFCADPTKFEQLRLNAVALIEAFPGTLEAYQQLTGYDWSPVLYTPITDAQGVANWTDSIFNASVPLTGPGHTGLLPEAGGVHHYPTPITDIEYTKHDDFQLWVTDAQGQPAAVAPAAVRGSGDGRVRVLYATPGTSLHEVHAKAHAQGEAVVLDDDHPLAKQAFARQ